MKRYINIDILKGVGIILVVLGHAIQTTYSDYANNPVFSIIYSFHMPLFMLLSGYVTKIQVGGIKGKFYSLVVPFLTWIFLSYLINQEWKQQSLMKKILAIIDSPDNGGLWFLWVLFLNSVLLYLCVSVANKYGVAEWKVIVPVMLAFYFMIFPYINVVGIRINTGMLGIGLARKYFLFYAIGYLWKKSENHVNQIEEIMSFVLFIVMASFYRWGTGFSVLNSLSGNIPEIFWEWINRMCHGIIALTGCVSIYILFCKIIKCSFLAKLGRFSGDIYILHLYLIGIIPLVTGSNVLDIIVKTIEGILLSIVIAVLLRKNRITGLLLLGKYKKYKPEMYK